MWAALTACFVLLLVVVLGAVVWAAANVISFLQPILIPVAIAVILTYLLDPLVIKMSRGTLSRTKAVVLLFAIAFFALGGLAAWLVPTISIQSANFARQVPAYTERARVTSSISSIDSTRHSAYSANTENRHRQVLPTGSLVRRRLLLPAHNRLRRQPHRRATLRPQLKQSARASRS